MSSHLSHRLRKQRTLAGTAAVSGIGYWTASDVCVEFRPAPENSGVTFIRADLPGQPRIPATIASRSDASRRTNLVAGDARVEMVEHILAPLYALGIDNCDVWVNSLEMPGCDGSSQAYIEAIDAAGIVEQTALRRRLDVHKHIRIGTDTAYAEAWPAIAEGLSVRVRLDFRHAAAIGRQQITREITPNIFRYELAAARTFILKAEAEALLQQGLCSRTTYRDLLVFDEAGPIDNPLRFRDECVRHKALDLVGDLALAGCDIAGHVVANCAGHRLHAELVQAILAAEAETPLKKSA